jgi:hypothetical protein
MSKTQVEHNKQIEGGFILPLLGAVASAVLPSLASAAIDRIMGKSLFIKSGSGIVKVKQLGDGIYLRPHRTEGITGDGLFIKRGGNYEPSMTCLLEIFHYSPRSLVGRPEVRKFDIINLRQMLIHKFIHKYLQPPSTPPVAVLWYPAEDVK